MKLNLKVLSTCAILAVGTGLLFCQEKSTAPGKAISLTKESTGLATNKVATSDFPIIGYIEKRDRTITIKSGPKETIYSVKSADGKVLCNNLTLEQLRAQSPELHEFVKTAVAGKISNGATGDSRLCISDGGATGDSRVRR
jgi:hypothetical protein